ncbi:MAG: GNAT family N-acetyltransferase [Myxococcota bacterium]
MASEYRGGCLCGAITYSFTELRDAGYCHCRACQRSTGSGAATWALVPTANFALTAGQPSSYRAVDGTERFFCGRCGSQLYVDHGDPDALAIALGTLDQPEAIEPRIHRCIEEGLSWFKLLQPLPWVEGRQLSPHEQRPVFRKPADPAVSSVSELSFRSIDNDNLRAILLLYVAAPQQRFVSLNSNSLAEALFADNVWYRGIYADDTAIGFIMMNVENEDYEGLPLTGEPFLWRFMIDENYQGMGFGRRAIDMACAEVMTWNRPSALWTSAVGGLGSPYPFYQKLGFVDTGVVEGIEHILRREL